MNKTIRNIMDVEGDFSNLLTYFSQVLKNQKRREFEVHDIHMNFVSYSYLENADNQLILESSDFPDKDKLDRIVSLVFKINFKNESYRITITQNFFSLDNSSNKSVADTLIEILDASTFRFF